MNEIQEVIVKHRGAGRNFLNASIPLLEGQRSQAKVDLYQPVADEVVGGLFARVFRYFQTILIDFHLWAEDLGPVVLRMMLESVFYMRFLERQSQPELYLAFQQYGIGQEKLYKLQLLKLMEEGKIKETPELREFIASDSDEEISDELLSIKLKNFMDVRQVAIDAGMADEYVLHYQPDSVHVHGHWPALRKFYLEMCQEPLHRLHLQPSFSLPDLDVSIVGRAVMLMGDAYDLWRARYGLEDVLQPLVDAYFGELKAAFSESGQAEPSEPTDSPVA
jgi:Family of unknown function (DUF5677)